MKHLITIILFILSAVCVFAQQSAVVDFESTSQGILIPRMTETQRLAIYLPDNGLLVYDITNKGVYSYDASTTSWTRLGPGIFQQQGDLIFGGDSNDVFIVADEMTGFNITNTQTIGGIGALNSKLFYAPEKAAIRAGVVSNDIMDPNFGAFDLANIGDFSVSFGLRNMANGAGSTVAGGAVNRASGIAAAVLGGEGNWATGDHTAVLGGKGNTAHDMSAASAGQYNIVGTGSDSSWIATDRLFTIGNGTSDIARSNAITVLKNGNTTITGDTSTLHLVGPTSIYGYHAKVNFGDANYVYLKEFEDDKLEIYAASGVIIRGSAQKMIGPSALKASSNTQTYQASTTTAYGISFNPEFHNLVTPIYLPQGTKIWRVDLWFDDTDAAQDLTTHIVRTTPTSGTVETICSISSSGSAGAGSDVDYPTSMVNIDNETYNYTLQVATTSTSSWTSTLQFKGIRIWYY